MESEKPGVIVGYEARKPSTGDTKKFTVEERRKCYNFAERKNQEHGSVIWVARPIINRD